MGTSVATLRLLSAARHPAAAARPRNFAHAAVRATPSVHSTHRRDRVVAWTTRWNLGRNLTVTRAVAEPHSGSSPNDDETDETEDDDDEASFDDDDYDDEDGGMDGDDTFVKMSQTELIMMTPEQRKEYHRRSVLEGQIRARNKRERQKHERISGEVFRPRERLKSQRDFQRVMNGGRNFNGKLMRIKYSGNEGLKDVDCTRIGIKVPKKFVKRAVDRNLMKRRIREIFRRNKDVWPARTDLIVMCSDTTLRAKYEDVKNEFLYWGNEYVPRNANKTREGGNHKGSKTWTARGNHKGNKGVAPPNPDKQRDSDSAPAA